MITLVLLTLTGKSIFRKFCRGKKSLAKVQHGIEGQNDNRSNVFFFYFFLTNSRHLIKKINPTKLILFFEQVLQNVLHHLKSHQYNSLIQIEVDK